MRRFLSSRSISAFEKHLLVFCDEDNISFSLETSKSYIIYMYTDYFRF